MASPNFTPEEIRSDIQALGSKRRKAIKAFHRNRPSKEDLIEVAAKGLVVGWTQKDIADWLDINRTQFIRDYLPAARAIQPEVERKMSLGKPPEPLARRG